MGQLEERQDAFLATLKTRFHDNMHHHDGLHWDSVRERLQTHPQKLCSLIAMEDTGGMVDVVGFDDDTNEYILFDCSIQTPEGRRKVCYDRAALDARKKNKPENSAIDMANIMGAKLLTEAEYRFLQTIETVDTKTSSWLETPPAIRQLGGAIFGDRRYDTVFVYHNGVQSYYAGRGFRCSLRI